MKKLIWGLSACALILSSCSQNEVLDNPLASNQIGFNNLNDRPSTKAANETDNDFGVYAVHSTAPTTFFFNNQQVSGLDPYNYSPVRVWPGGDIDFYGYAPYNSTNLDKTAVANNAGVLNGTVNYTVPAAADEDLTFASKVTKAAGVVDFSFSHMLSKITLVEVKLAPELVTAGYSIGTQPTLNVMVDYNKGTNDLFKAMPEDWTALGSSLTAPAKNKYTAASSYYIMPQPSTNQYIQLSGITINHATAGNYTGDILIHKIEAGTTVDNLFKRGNWYKITITLGTDTRMPDTNNPNNPDMPGDRVFNVITFAPTVMAWQEEAIDLGTTTQKVASPSMAELNAATSGQTFSYPLTVLTDNQTWNWAAGATFDGLGMAETAMLDFSNVTYNSKTITVVAPDSKVEIQGAGVTKTANTPSAGLTTYVIASGNATIVKSTFGTISKARINALTNGKMINVSALTMPTTTNWDWTGYTFAGLTKQGDKFMIDFSAPATMGGAVITLTNLPVGYTASNAGVIDEANRVLTITRNITSAPSAAIINALTAGGSASVSGVVVNDQIWSMNTAPYTFVALSTNNSITLDFTGVTFEAGKKIVLEVPATYEVSVGGATAATGGSFQIDATALATNKMVVITKK